MKKFLISIVVVLFGLSGCQSKSVSNDDAKAKVAVVINQRFGDNGPMDNLAEGLDKAEEDFDVIIKKIESDNAAKFEEDIRAMAKDGYELIITTFPYMTDATKLIAEEYPNTKFAAIFQFVNNGNDKYENIWDTEFHGEQAFFISGYMAGLLSEKNKIGLVIGAEEPTPNAEGNAFMRGVKEANPDSEVEFSFVGSYEDPAKAKEIALAMESKGVDLIVTDSGASNAGVIEVCKEKGLLCSGEITDFYEQYKGFYGVVGIGFGDTAYKAIEAFVNGGFEGGTHGIRDLSNGGYFLAWETYERFANENSEFGGKMTEIIAKAKELEKAIIDGTKVIDFDDSVPNWSKIKQE